MSEEPPAPQQIPKELDEEALHAAARILNQYGGGPAREAYHASEFEATVNEYAQDRDWRETAFNDLKDAFEDQEARISQLESSYADLLADSQIDSLTKVYNREGFARALAAKLAQMKREDDQERVHQFVMADLDDFKDINDTHHHAGGDVVLRTVARTMSRELPDMLVGRFGGEEFMILLEDTSPEEAKIVLAKLNRLFRNTTFVRTNGESIDLKKPVSACFGFAEMTARDDPMEALDRADAALYQSKAIPGKAAITEYNNEGGWVPKRRNDR